MWNSGGCAAGVTAQGSASSAAVASAGSPRMKWWVGLIIGMVVLLALLAAVLAAFIVRRRWRRRRQVDEVPCPLPHCSGVTACMLQALVMNPGPYRAPWSASHPPQCQQLTVQAHCA